MHNFFPYPVLIFLLLIACQPQEEPATEFPTYLESQGSAWHVALGQADADAESEVFYATYEGQLICQEVGSQAVVFAYDLGAFPFSMAVADLDEDGLSEAIAVTAEGQLLVVDAKGELLWEFKSPMALFQVTVGKMAAGQKPIIAAGGLDRTLYFFNSEGKQVGALPGMERSVHRLAMGNLDADPEQELLLIENRTVASVIEWENGQPVVAKRETLRLDDEYKNWENPQGELFAFDLKLTDLDQDGVDEILIGDTYFNKQIVAALDAEFNTLWVSDKVEFFSFQEDPDRYTEFYSTAFVEASDFYPDTPGLEVASVAGGQVRVFDQKGELLGEALAKVGFADLHATGQQLLLGSTPNGDQTVYSLDFSAGWEEQVLGFERQGKVKTIEDNLMALRDQVLEYPQPAELPDQTYTFILGGVSPADEGKEFFKERTFLQERFPYPNLLYKGTIKVMESTPPLNPDGEPWSESRWRVDAIRGTMTVDEILEMAAWIEENQVPTLFYIGHSCMPFITLETAEKILQTAPNYCEGFRTAEDEQIERIPQYFEHFYKPLSELCLKYGKKLNVTKNKGIWWVSSPSLPAVHEAMFEGGRKEINVASTEDSNSRTPEMNILGRAGLWLADLTDYIHINTNSDLFSFNRYFQWEYPKHGHPYFRRMVAHTLMGGSRYNIRHMDKIETDKGYSFSQMGKESSEIVFHMLGKGLLMQPERGQVRGYNPIGFAMHPPPEKWLEDAHNGHTPERWKDDPELHNAILPHNGVPWGMTNTPEHALQSVLLHKERQFGYNIPATPYGLLAFVPAQADLENVPGIREWWHTDGIYIWKEGGEKLTGMEAANRLQEDFALSAQEMPFRYEGDDIFLQTLEISPGVFRLYLIDPGWLDPAGRTVTIIPKNPDIDSVKDLLAGEGIEMEASGTFSVTVPAGAMRVLEVRE